MVGGQGDDDNLGYLSYCHLGCDRLCLDARNQQISRTCLIEMCEWHVHDFLTTNHGHEVTDSPKPASLFTHPPQRNSYVLAPTNLCKPQMSQHMGAMIGQYTLITSSLRLECLGFYTRCVPSINACGNITMQVFASTQVTQLPTPPPRP
jgi:hypothetical protein